MTYLSLSLKNPVLSDIDSGFMAIRHYGPERQQDYGDKSSTRVRTSSPCSYSPSLPPMILENKGSCCDILKEVLELKPAEHPWQKGSGYFMFYVFASEYNWYDDYGQLVL